MKQFLVFIVIICSIQLNAQTGIGTTSPVNKFQVETAAAAPSSSGVGFNGNLRLGATGANQVMDFGLGTTYGWIQARDKTGYGTNYILALNPNGGSVGVGTNTISSTLTVGNTGGTIAGEITLNPSSTQYEGGQVTLKKSILGSTADWIIDQYGTSSSDARMRIFNSLAESNGIAILENGNIGMGLTNPTVRLQVNGDIIANSIAGSSDIRFKQNIRPIANALQKVKSIRGVYFNWNQNAFPEKNFGSQDEIGFIAQELEKIVPEVVTKDKTKEEFRSVKYDKIVALLVEAIKEQQNQIDSLKIALKKLKK